VGLRTEDLGVEAVLVHRQDGDAPAQAVVTDLGAAVGLNEDISRLQVSVHDVGLVDETERAEGAVNYF